MRFGKLGWVPLAGAAVGLLCWAGPSRAEQHVADRPGQETHAAPPDPSILQSLLPPFTAAALERAPEVDGWGPLQLSPAGRFCLAQLRSGARQSVSLLDANGVPLRDLTTDRAVSAAAVWGYSDQHILLEMRPQPTAKPEFQHLDRVSGAITPATIPGLPHWSPLGKDYWLSLPGGWQRYAGEGNATGHVVVAREPVWSGDGQWLAYTAAHGRADEKPSPVSGLEEVRLLPSRGDVARVLVSAPGWERLAKEKGWSEARGPERLVWSSTGDALFGFVNARTEAGEGRFLVRLDLHSPKREALPVPPETRLVSASGDTHHWLVQLGDQLFRLDFGTPAPKKQAPDVQPKVAN